MLPCHIERHFDLSPLSFHFPPVISSEARNLVIPGRAKGVKPLLCHFEAKREISLFLCRGVSSRPV